jgi:anti-sigma regulatory factor (Ser/Thr protein kinase)
MDPREEDGVVFIAQMSELAYMLAWVREKLDPLAMTKTDKKKVELAVEEALVNIIRYAYKNSRGEVAIYFHLSADSEVVFRVEDEGVAFNPFEEICAVPKEVPLEERQIGGLGILFMVGMMDAVDYDRINL